MHDRLHDAAVTGQLPDTPTCGLPTRGLDNSRMPPAVICTFKYMIMWTYNTSLCHIEVFHNKMQLDMVVKPFINASVCASVSFTGL